MHTQDQRPVVHLRIQLIGADADLLIGMGDTGVELKEPFILDEPRVVELVGHSGHTVLRCHLHGGLFQGPPVEGTEVGAHHPAHARQNGGGQQDKDQVACGAQHRVPSPAAGVALGAVCGRGPVLALGTPDLLGIPAGGIISSIFRHRFLLTSPLRAYGTGQTVSACSFFHGQAHFHPFQHRIVLKSENGGM